MHPRQRPIPLLRLVLWYGLVIGCLFARAADSSLPIKSVALNLSPLVPRTAAGERHILVVTIESDGLNNATVRLSAPGWPAAIIKTISSLAKGKQHVEFETVPLAAPLSVKVQLEVAGQQREFGPFALQPPRHWTIYLNQHTHTDIGYTRPQTEILPEHLRYIDYALDYCDQTDALPDNARFRWTCETAWAVREYLKSRPPSQIARFRKRVQEGRIEIGGLLLNMSEIATENSLAALVRPIREIQDVLGVPVQTAMQDDVNGAGWCLVDYFHGIGIRYLTMGINETRSILPFDKPTPFWWESPSGKRVLAYRADHYMTANFWGIEKGDLQNFRPHVAAYLSSLSERGYPFDRVAVQFSGYFTDNSPPSTAACALVRAWNETYAWPQLRLSTVHEFLAWVEKQHPDTLEVHRQAWPDWWTDGFASAARETAAARETEAAMDVTHGLLALASLLGAPVANPIRQHAAAIQDDLLFYHEHTYGAAESISDPLAENSQVQWGEKSAFAWSAVKESAICREEAFGLLQDFLPRAEVPTLAVVNTLNWSRSGLVQVYIDHQIIPPDREFRILDGTQPVPVQAMETRADGTYWCLWVQDVPALGWKVLRIETTSRPRAKEPAEKDVLALENSFYKLALDPTSGAIRTLIDKETGAELVEQGTPWHLGQCVYETMPPDRKLNRNAFKHTSVRSVKIKGGANGPIWRSLVATADLDGCTTNGLRTEIRLYATEKRAELHFTMRKLPVPTPEAVYVVMPFQAPQSRILYEAQGGLVTPGQDQLPGSSSDWQTLQSFLSIQNAHGQIVLGSLQAPLVQLGDFNLGKWMRVASVEQPHVYSWVMNNYWFTNFRTEQEGDFKWSYYLTSGRNTSSAEATRFGWGSRVPFATRVLPAAKRGASPRPAVFSTLSFPAPNLLLVESRPARDGKAIILHLREMDGKPTILLKNHLTCAARIQRLDEVNVLEAPLKTKLDSVPFAPFETRFLKLTLR